MKSSTYPLDLPDAKAYLSIRPDDVSQDGFLTDCIEAVCDELAQWLPFSIIEEDVEQTVSPTWQIPGREIVITLMPPVLEVSEVRWTDRDGNISIMDPAEWRLVGSTVRIPHISHTTDTLTVCYRVGAQVPPSIRTALLMMLRSRYERRDEDPMTESVWSAVRPYMRANI